MDQRVFAVIELLRHNMEREWPIQELTQAVNLSPSRLHQLFKEQTGVSPAKYLKLVRLEHAKGLLESSFLSVKEIRNKVGIRDESHFMRDFRNAYGFTPTQYRARHFLEARAAEEAESSTGQFGPAERPEDENSVREGMSAETSAEDDSVGMQAPAFFKFAVEL
jgi:AraC-like DNA-binding protein